MVQVDIFWSYGIGAGLAVAAHRQIKEERGESGTAWQRAMQSPYFAKVLLFLGLVFVPSGFWLLWQFSSWETMHAGGRDLPVWLVGLFAVTNISQGALGFIICHSLIRQGRLYAAWLNFILAYVGFFFILIHGWDGKGYQRFFSPDRHAFEQWDWTTAAAWFRSDVALTLYGMGVILIPILVGMTMTWIRQGLRQKGREAQPLAAIAGFLGSVFLLAFGLALLCSLSLMALGWLWGTALGLAVLGLGLLPKARISPSFFQGMTRQPGL